MRGKYKKIEVQADIKYNSLKVAKFVNSIMHSGKKNTARRIVYDAFELIKEKTGNPNPLEIFDLAIKNVSPLMEVRSRRVGGANYQVPREVKQPRRTMLAIRWIIGATRKGKGRPTYERLAEELIAASKNEGEAVRKRETSHKMAESNKAFAHFAW